jgi:catechol 2,3-dioxygenase-like lactoylglutathione lyase family enzyme
MSIRRAVPNIVSDTPDESRRFYAGLLGFQVAMDMGWIITFVSPSNPTAQAHVLGSLPAMPRSRDHDCGSGAARGEPWLTRG